MVLVGGYNSEFGIERMVVVGRSFFGKWRVARAARLTGFQLPAHQSARPLNPSPH
jgi:hypothetical protein